jgi:hypothetical protein
MQPDVAVVGVGLVYVTHRDVKLFICLIRHEFKLILSRIEVLWRRRVCWAEVSYIVADKCITIILK